VSKAWWDQDGCTGFSPRMQRIVLGHTIKQHCLAHDDDWAKASHEPSRYRMFKQKTVSDFRFIGRVMRMTFTTSNWVQVLMHPLFAILALLAFETVGWLLFWAHTRRTPKKGTR
jgi:hypothetical protein